MHIVHLNALLRFCMRFVQVDVTEIFSSHANMSGMLDQNKPVWVKDIIHKAKLEINEKGAKAAAATGNI